MSVMVARLGALGFPATIAEVTLETESGPSIAVDFVMGLGFHALDAALLVVGVPLAVMLVHYAEQLAQDDKGEVNPAPSEPRWRCWEQCG